MLLRELGALYVEHCRCGELDGGVAGRAGVDGVDVRGESRSTDHGTSSRSGKLICVTERPIRASSSAPPLSLAETFFARVLGEVCAHVGCRGQLLYWHRSTQARHRLASIFRFLKSRLANSSPPGHLRQQLASLTLSRHLDRLSGARRLETVTSEVR